jgi:hypothetical protein
MCWQKETAGRSLMSSMIQKVTGKVFPFINLVTLVYFDALVKAATNRTWKAAVAAKRAEIMNNRSRYVPADAQLGFRPANFIPDDVRVVDKSYLSNSFRSKEWQKTINDVSCSFQLNKDQSRAFRIVANHICNNDSEQLKMHQENHIYLIRSYMSYVRPVRPCKA